jgi:CBS domain containing-hemolysin-like protein
MMSSVLLTVAILFALAVSAFCSGAETGFMSVSRGRILHLARAGGVRAKIVYAAILDMGRTTIALLVGNNLANVIFSSSSAALSAAVFPHSQGMQAAWGAMAAIGLLFAGEFFPKLLCSASPLRRILMLAPVWCVFGRVFSPVGTVLQMAINRFLPKREATARVTPESVLRILEDRKDGVRLSDFESAMVGRIMVLRSKGLEVVPDALLCALDDC